MTNLPQKTHDYLNHPIIKSDRWEAYNHRPGDIVVTTSYKAGTTWMQNIIANLIFQDGKLPAPITQMSPWIDMDMIPLEDIMAGIEAQTWRRPSKHTCLWMAFPIMIP